ncbi:putative transcriptional regulator [Tissierella praeacuta]|uniref:helix-turn-helix transcriptional regulator n=1 Tax=Tissierella praeacuta TaxID=43131 RepID=UPI0010439735|nr:helix-turn-helix transcriptional regulator [Tissierella praeacuta]TCU64446.1 putative transcriptional regulator [Tissierella praeacuta]
MVITRKVLINKRIKNKITQDRLAQMIGISQQMISLIETGKRRPTIEIAKKLEVLFKTPMEELFADIFSNIN